MRRLIAASLIVVSSSASAQAATPISLVGTILNTCIITLSTPGVLVPSADGQTISSSEGLGVKALLAIVSTGTAPTITFSAPTLTGPSASVSGATKTLAYSSLGGANQAPTSGTFTYTANRLLDTVTIDGKATNPNGFATGAYTIGTTATCQQQ